MEAIFKREIILNKTACRFIGVTAFIFLTALSAFVRIPLPFTPVPVTLQTLFVLLSGAFLGANLGGISQVGYILLGTLGLSIFTGVGSGVLYILGPTGGYLAGFVLASIFVAKFINSARNNFLAVFFLFCLADLVLLTSGMLWLKISLSLNTAKALMIGILPFIPGDLLKAFAAAMIYVKFGSRAREIF